jgi:GNAT superfamily N-acetyltransferase
MDFSTPTIEEQPAAADREFLEDQINQFNMRQVGAFDGRALAGFVRDAAGTIVAGISGYTWAGMCEIQFLWVHAAQRGQGLGSALLAAAETEARRRGCSVIVLGTYSFQAPAFYPRHGYTVTGTIPDCPPGQTHYILQKRLDAAD